ncbi:MAG TPA: hypothetical protein VGN26_18190, partial [Armatimonadota bacterium]
MVRLADAAVHGVRGLIPPEVPLYSSLLASVVGIVENAGQQALRSLAAAALVGELKADSTVVTRLDREMEQLLEPQL